MTLTKRLLICLTLLLPASFAQNAPRNVMVSATGTAYGTPDEASFDAGVSVLKADVQVAITEVSETVASLLEALEAAGVAEKDLRTANFTVSPEQTYDNNGQPTSLRYRVTNTVHVTVRDAAQLGVLLGESTGAGANDIANVIYMFSDQDALERRARQAAMTRARDKAEQLAQFGGAGLGAVQRIREGVADDGGPVAMFRSESLVSASAEVPVSSGQLAVTVSVQVTFGLK